MAAEAYPRKFGKYHLLGPLAQGGMGALYLAVNGDRGLERLMVIKTVLPHLADAEYVARFRDEAKVVVKLSHGNLIPVFDAGLVTGEMFLAMDFVEGRDLRAVWNRCAKKQVAFPIDVAVHAVKELCRGLSYAHTLPDLELVHRDVSPPNVLVSFSGEVKLTDFGLASSTLKLEKTAPGIIYGKVAYMSPEQARGEKLDGSSDQYAAGIVLWELLTGRQLFPPGKDQPQDLVSRAKNPEVTPPSKRAPRVPVELDEICLRALAPSRKDRYSGCDEMRQALQGWLAKNSPSTDVSRIATFMNELFVDDIQTDRIARGELLNGLRKRAMTLPPSDEFRQLVERSSEMAIAKMPSGFDNTGTADGGGEAPVRSPGSVGRRADDLGQLRSDRRQSTNRRGDLSPSPVPVPNGGLAMAAALSPAIDPEAEIDLVDTVVDNRYRVVELVGEGGMGKVYLAEHIEIGRRVAIKVLHPSYGRMPDLVERFRREARAASKIGHPNIVDVTDSGTTPDGSVFFVMEFLEGLELGSVIDREGAIAVPRALKIASQICRALAAAHNVGIIHRDLKPENVFLITREGAADFVKVLDFGIAKTTEAEQARERKLTSPGMAMGTPEYMAPEQAAGRSADARCDVYALGAIAFEMLTGVPPYSGDNFMEILTKKATVDPIAPSLLRPELPPAVSDLILRAMARNPDIRPQTMEAFEYELNKCLAGRGIAVAQMLGMSSDASLVATLNPGLSGGLAQSGGRFGEMSSPSLTPLNRVSVPVMTPPAASRPHSSPALASHVALVSPPYTVAMPVPAVALSAQPLVSSVSSVGHLRMPTPLPMPLASAASSGGTLSPGSSGQLISAGISTQIISVPVLPQRKSSVGGWFLAIALVAGAGAIAYVGVNEWKVRQAKNSQSIVVPPVTSSPSPDGGGGSAAVATENLTDKPNSKAIDKPIIDGAGSAAPAKIDDKPKSPRIAPPPIKPATVATQVEVSTTKGGKTEGELWSIAQKADKASQFKEAAELYQQFAARYGKSRYFGQSLYRRAYNLFNLGSFADAASVARLAAKTGYAVTQSLLLEADSNCRANNRDKANEQYKSLLAGKVTTKDKVDIEARMKRCNSK